MKMQKPKPKTPNALAPAAGSARGFTLMELMVSIGILVIIILSVGMTFSGVSKSVGMSQATMEEMAGMRAVQQLIERDIKSLDRNGYLVIRSRALNPNNDRSYRFDQLGFMAVGAFPNQSGADSNSPFSDSSVAGAAVVWWGQGVLESANPRDGTYLNPSVLGQGQDSRPDTPDPWTARLPTGIDARAFSGKLGSWENECTLMRHTTLLFPGPWDARGIRPAGNPVMAYASPAVDTPMIQANSEGKGAHITSSRFGAAAMTPGQLLQTIDAERARLNDWPEAYRYTYRFRALDPVYDTDVTGNPFVNGYFRTTPIVMRGVSSFRVDWTDGASYTSGALTGQTMWYGPTGPGNVRPFVKYGSNNDTPNPSLEEYADGGLTLNANLMGDQYIAVFNHTNRAEWPKALRITAHVASDRLGGRDFVQVVNLPQ
jgi:prepilin-type N-terminal cleavage/methylation domain-containing protein